MYRTSDPHLAHYVVFALSGIATILLPNLARPSSISPKPIAKLAGILVVTISCVVLIGWVFDIAIFKSVIPDLATMKFNTAFALLLLGISLLLFEAQRSQKMRLTARCLAGMVTV